MSSRIGDALVAGVLGVGGWLLGGLLPFGGVEVCVGGVGGGRGGELGELGERGWGKGGGGGNLESLIGF